MASEEFTIGVDLGGTKSLACVFDAKMRVVSQAKAKTPAGEGGDAVLRLVAEIIQEACHQADLKPSQALCVGVAVPAPIDPSSGTVLLAPNMGMRDYPFGPKLSMALGLPIKLANDVQAGIWGEYILGALKGFSNSLGIFIGTGIGGGIIINGRLWKGAHGHAGEIGHMILSESGAACGCGQYGCYEAMASRTAMAKDAVAAASSGKSLAFARLGGTDFKKYKSSVFEQALAEKDAVALRIMERSAHWSGLAMANLVNAFDPEAIVLGGGIIARLGELYVAKARQSMEQHIIPAFHKGVRVFASKLGDLAVPSGAALLSQVQE